MESKAKKKVERTNKLQTGTGKRHLSDEERHFFDVRGYLVVEKFLKPDQVNEAREALQNTAENPLASITVNKKDSELELLNIVENGGIIEDAITFTRLLQAMEEIIWGSQVRLVASRGLIREPGSIEALTQGGKADPRRYTRYRCFVEGEFRCLMTTCLVALNNCAHGNGTFCIIPSSHKSNFSHPYSNVSLEAVPVLKDIALKAGDAIIFSENLSHAMKSPINETHNWLSYQYGPSYMLSWPGCEASMELRTRTADSEIKTRLLKTPYYHPWDHYYKDIVD